MNGDRNHYGGLATIALRTVVVLAVLGGSALLLGLVWGVRKVLIWLLIAIILAVTVEPLVLWLERHHVRRWLGATLVTLGAALVVAGIIAAVAVPVINESRHLVRVLPQLVHDLLKPGGPFAALEHHLHLEHQIGTITPARVFHLLAGPRTFSSMFSQAAGVLGAAVTVVAITIMLLIEGPRGWHGLIWSLGERGAPVALVGHRMQHSVGGYARGNILVSLLASVCSFAVMMLLGVPYALPLSLAVGLLDIIPLVGATIGAALCVLVALSVGWPQAVGLVAFFVIYQQVENHVLAPAVYSKTVVMSPLTVLLVSLAGAFLGGVVGVLIAIPLASAAQIALGEILRANGIERLADLIERQRGGVSRGGKSESEGDPRDQEAAGDEAGATSDVTWS